MRAASIAVVALAALGSLLLYPELPAVIAIHWNAYGQADGYAPKGVALALMPAIMGVLVFVLAIFARRTEGPSRTAFEATSAGTQLFLLFVHGVMIAAGLGVAVPVERAIPFGISLLFAFIGLFMPRLAPNPVMGIRTRRTMSDPELWRATHVFAGRLFVAGGLLLAAACLVGASFWLVFAGFLALGFVPLGYSYVTSSRSR
jgi:uncharacterized membrane protein